jgi:16S rRNA C1402 (ribose-2'-O) methylase RsmI
LEPKIDLLNAKQREAFRNLLVIMAEENYWATQLLEAFDTDCKFVANKSHP